MDAESIGIHPLLSPVSCLLGYVAWSVTALSSSNLPSLTCAAGHRGERGVAVGVERPLAEHAVVVLGGEDGVRIALAVLRAGLA